MNVYLGIDVGSVSTNLVAMTPDGAVAHEIYLRTGGEPVRAVQEGMRLLSRAGLGDGSVCGCGVTGSARRLIGHVLGADMVKNEISAHARAAVHLAPEARTVIEIGGQDSKFIVVRDGRVRDFAMNAVCAAGTGAFLEAQAARLGVPVERFGLLALAARAPVPIAGRCTVFAESDMVHKQQAGHAVEDIVAGLCAALVRNYLATVAKGKPVAAPVVFQGGVSGNAGMKRAFEQALGCAVVVPPHNMVMGALGMCLYLRAGDRGGRTSFRGLGVADEKIDVAVQPCAGCSNNCRVFSARIGASVVGTWNDRCGKWSGNGGAGG
ncbi:2-hydroxyglutaryl-CoA dehydratase [bacterium]|nr:2-hydroxyglutaryl-CoA dehydratase [bacterium]